MATTTFPMGFEYTDSNVYLDALIFGGAWGSNTSTIEIEYALRSGEDPYEINGLTDGNTWSSTETSAVENAMQAWENVADIDLVRTTDTDDADIWYWKGEEDDVGALGWHEVPTDSIVEPLYGVFADDGDGWTASGLQAGGYAYVTLIHEIGHGLGLDHPHPDDEESDAFPGVTSAFGDYGDDDLNQGIFTLMSYNDGWPSEYPNHSASNEENYGFTATPMAFDIAATQEIYGANLSYNTGNNTYSLPDINDVGTYWAAIWDAGGTDEISAEGSSRDFDIDLRDAPLIGDNAGGYVSYSDGIVGGFTIANGVTIENASGGNGDDKIIGNEADNLLKGGSGADTLTGGNGSDTLVGGKGNDVFSGGNSSDYLFAGGAGADQISGGEGVDTLSYGNAIGRAFVDLAIDQRGASFLTFFTEGAASGSTFSGVENVTGGSFADNIRGDSSGNQLAGGRVSDRLYGRAGDDTLLGGTGADALYGGIGADVMTGGEDEGRRDRYIYFSSSESGVGAGNRDIVTDFVVDEDRIEITRLDANTNISGNNSFNFIGDENLSGTAGELGYRHESAQTIVQADFDGDGAADFEITLSGILTLTVDDFLI